MTQKRRIMIMMRKIIKALVCKIACPIQSQSWIALSSLEQWQSSMSGDAMMRMMLMRMMVMMRMLMIQCVMLITTTIIIIFSALIVFKIPLQIHHTPVAYSNIAMRIISTFQDSRTRQGHPLLTHLARYSADVPNSASASTSPDHLLNFEGL